jgi:hypothetical protein
MSFTGIGEVANLATSIVNKIWPDKSQQEKDALAFQMQQMVLQSDLLKGQMAIDQAEASNKSIFVAGWRPGIGWACGAAFAWTYVLEPLASFTLSAIGHPVKLPALDISGMMPVLLGMLGLGGMRSLEKVKGLNPGN